MLDDCLIVMNNQNILSHFIIDISSELKGFMLSMNVFEQIHYINNIYIVIFKEVEKYKNSENELLEQLKEHYPFIQQAHAEFIVKNRVFKKYTSKIKEIRSQVAAHFDINLNYWEYLTNFQHTTV